MIYTHAESGLKLRVVKADETARTREGDEVLVRSSLMTEAGQPCYPKDGSSLLTIVCMTDFGPVDLHSESLDP